MRPAKLFATLFCGSVLAVQSYEVFSSMGYNNYYWPFMNYPMYSNAHRVGASFDDVQLRALPCDNPRDTLRLQESDLHVMSSRYFGLIYGSAGLSGLRARSAPNADDLLGLITRYVPRPVCRVQVWQQKYNIGPRGLEYPGESWEIAREWELPPRTLPTGVDPKP